MAREGVKGMADEKKKNRRPRGTGCIYKRGNIYWIKYYRYGKEEKGR
jgi:hypothetical protein